MKAILLLIGFVFLACGQDLQDPLKDKKGTLTEIKPPAQASESTRPAFGILVRDLMEFVEGQLNEYSVETWVPQPGKPILTVSGLPAGATFDEQRLKISWQPPMDAANDPRNLTVSVRYYPVILTLRSDSEPALAPLRREVFLVVRDLPRDMGFNFPSNRIDIREGVELQQRIRIQNEDFPQGPFLFSADGLPKGAMVYAEGPTTFVVRWTPWYDFTSKNDRYMESCHCHYKSVDVQFVAMTMRGFQIRSPKIEWRVLDSRPALFQEPSTPLISIFELNFPRGCEE